MALLDFARLIDGIDRALAKPEGEGERR